MSKEDIKRMVNDAEKFKADDEKQDRISAQDGLERYRFKVKTILDDDQLNDKISEDDMTTIIDKRDEAFK